MNRRALVNGDRSGGADDASLLFRGEYSDSPVGAATASALRLRAVQAAGTYGYKP